MNKIIDIEIEDYTAKDREECNIAYVCYSRAIKQIVNAKHLPDDLENV